MAKNIIDWGRVTYLRKYGYNAELIQYVDKESTLENVCLMADLGKNGPRDYTQERTDRDISLRNEAL